MTRKKKSFRELVDRDVDSVGHAPVSMQNGLSHTVGDFELLANGNLVLGGKTFRDMESVNVGHKLMPAVRKPGYGKPLVFDKENAPTVYRFIYKLWYRLSAGGPALGRSPFFSSTVASSPLLVQKGDGPLELDGDKYRLGGSVDAALVTLFADGRVKVFDLEFFPGDEIDVSSPQSELARMQGLPYIAVRVPEDSQNFLLDYPHALAVETTWLTYADGSWYPLEISRGIRVTTPQFLRPLGSRTATVLRGPR